MEFLKISTEANITTVQLDRGTANALQTGMIKEIIAAFEQLSSNSETRAVVMVGKGNFFSAGLDVIEIEAYDAAQSLEFWNAFSKMIETLLAFPKPFITAINGHSPAGGAILSLTSDFRYMAEGKFRIGLNEVPVGIAVPEPIFDLYANVIGRKNAYQYLLEGKLSLPEEALAVGLVDEVLPQTEVYTRAIAKAAQLIQLEPKTFALTKLAMRRELLAKFSAKDANYFENTVKHWSDPDARKILKALVDGLKSKA